MDSLESSASRKFADDSIMGDDQAAKKNEVMSYVDTLGIEMVDIHVGKDLNVKQFRIHKAILCEKVPYFAKMFNSGFKEAMENKAGFPEDQWETFDVLQEWVYTGKLRKLCFTVEGRYPSYSYDPIRLYRLLDKLCLSHLGDELVSAYLEANREAACLPSIQCIDHAYTWLPPTSKFLRRFLLAFHFIMSGMNRNKKNRKIWPANRLSKLLVDHPSLCRDYVELALRHPIREPVEDPRKMPHYLFHHHGEDEECSVGTDT